MLHNLIYNEAEILAFLGVGGSWNFGFNFLVGVPDALAITFMKRPHCSDSEKVLHTISKVESHHIQIFPFCSEGGIFDPLAQCLNINEFHLFFGWSVFLPNGTNWWGGRINFQKKFF